MKSVLETVCHKKLMRFESGISARSSLVPVHELLSLLKGFVTALDSLHLRGGDYGAALHALQDALAHDEEPADKAADERNNDDEDG